MGVPPCTENCVGPFGKNVAQFYLWANIILIELLEVHGFLSQMEHFLTDMSNRVEHQNEPKRPQSGGRLGSFWCSTRPSADTGTD